MMAMLRLSSACFLLCLLPGLCADSVACESAAVARAADELGYTNLVQLQTSVLAPDDTPEKPAGGAAQIEKGSQEDQTQTSALAHDTADEDSTSDAAESSTQTGTLNSTSSQEDSLTVMIFNTYLLEYDVLGVEFMKTPNMAERATGIAAWFNTLSTEEVPDILVLNEIFSNEGEQVVRSICTDSFREKVPLLYWNVPKVMECDSSSHFAFSTKVNGAVIPTGGFKSGGVVMLVKKGLNIEFAHEEAFKDTAGLEILSQKGFWASKIIKNGKRYWAVGTHAKAFEAHVDVRLKQFTQMRRYVDSVARPGDRLVYAGDMNIFTNTQTLPTGREITSAMLETSGMLQALGDVNAPADVGELEESGFWLPLSTPLSVSWDETNNHLITYRRAANPEAAEGDHMYDWVLVPGAGDRFDGPQSMKRQVVPVLADACFPSEEMAGTTTDELSDHYAIFAKLCYEASCAPTTPIVGHRGSTGQIPSGPTC